MKTLQVFSDKLEIAFIEVTFDQTDIDEFQKLINENPSKTVKAHFIHQEQYAKQLYKMIKEEFKSNPEAVIKIDD